MDTPGLKTGTVHGTYPRNRCRQTSIRAALFHCTDCNEQSYQMHPVRSAFAETAKCGTGRNKRCAFDQPCHLLPTIAATGGSRPFLLSFLWFQNHLPPTRVSN